MSKKYIFITHSIKNVGGVQCYLAAKAKYLEEHGWEVKIIFPAQRSDKYKCPIQYLEKYLSGNILWSGIAPFKIPHLLVKKTLNRMLSIIGDVNSKEDIIVETHDDTFSQWGELVASKIGARHYMYLMNEYYRNSNQSYEAKIDFYRFKFDRHEILGGIVLFNKLFEGYRTIKEGDFPGEVIVDESPIQDVQNEKVSQIDKRYWNICYIGRGNKPYVPYILIDVGKFASAHPDRSIQLIIVSSMDSHQDLINRIKSENTNLYINEIGLLHPIPKDLYTKLDVVIAGSGSARHSCEEGALTIIADPETNKSNGLLGYDTLNSIYKDANSVESDFCEALERVLVKKEYAGVKNRWPKSKGIEYCVQQNFELFSHSKKEKEYYDEDKLLEGIVNYRQMVTTWLFNNYPIFSQKMAHLLGMDKSKIRKSL